MSEEIPEVEKPAGLKLTERIPVTFNVVGKAIGLRATLTREAITSGIALSREADQYLVRQNKALLASERKAAESRHKFFLAGIRTNTELLEESVSEFAP